MLRKFALFASCFAAAWMLCSCSGSSSSGPPANPTPRAVATTGKVTVLLTDAPGQDWDQAIATITSIELLGDGSNVPLFEGETSVDLLSLPDFYEIFAVTDGIFPSTFHKIRLRLRSLELVDLDDQGAEVDRIEAKLVGNGKIDLLPGDDIVIAAGDSIYIEIDFDMNKAFKTTTTGNGKVIVRPVILVNVTAVPPATKLTRLAGTIATVDSENRRFELCQDQLVSEMSNGAEGSASTHNQCIDVVTDEATGIFGPDGLPVELADLEVGLKATAIGFLRRGDEIGDEAVLEAVTIELGEDFVRVAGVAGGAVMGDIFDLNVDSEQEPGADDEVLSTQLFPRTRIFRTNGDELDPTAILAGVGIVADGVRVENEMLPDTLRAALLILDPDRNLPADVLSGEIVSIDTDNDTLQLLTDGTERCVNAATARIFLVSNVDGFSSTQVELNALEPTMHADVFGDGEDGAGCLLATDIQASAVAGNTLPVANAGEDRIVATGAGVMLDGSASFDDDSDPLTYAWTLTSIPEGSTATLLDADTALPTFTADLAGDYVAELIVNDGAEDSAPDEVVITAAAP